MRITTFADIAIQILLILKSETEERLYNTKQLSELVDTPVNHVSKIVTKLGEHGYIKVVRGRSGGAIISEKGRNAKVGEVLRQLKSPKLNIVNEHLGEEEIPGITKYNRAKEAGLEAYFSHLDKISL